MVKRGEPPEYVKIAIEKLTIGEKEGIARAHQTLQKAILGGYLCLRTNLPQKSNWAETVWGEFVVLLGHDNNHVRSIAGQMLSNLSQSVSSKTALRDLDKVIAVTRDEMFVTARHVLQALWKFGLGTNEQRNALLSNFTDRFKDSGTEKNATLLRYDIIVGLRALYNETGDEAVMSTANKLISLEDDAKYRKKYARVWRDLIDKSLSG